MPQLNGKIAVVTGANRGIGRGIAIGLGEAGATVYVAGRATRKNSPDSNRTIEDAADAVTAAGGKGIAVETDFASDADVKALFEQVEREQGSLDLLVNNVFKATNDEIERKSFWERGLESWDDHMDVGCRSHYVASYYAAPMMVRKKAGLIVNISSVGGVWYMNSPAYGVAKAAVDKMTRDTGWELRRYNVAAVSLWPGVIRTEYLIELRDKNLLPPALDFAKSESPLFVGRVVAALAADPMIMELSRKVHTTHDLAVRYGARDEDGSLPPPQDISFTWKQL